MIKNCHVMLKKARGAISDYQTLEEAQLEKSTIAYGYTMIALKQSCDKAKERS